MVVGPVDFAGNCGERVSAHSLRGGTTCLRFSARQGLWILLLLFPPTQLLGQSGGEMRFSLKSDPKTFNPLLVEDEPSYDLRYLTGGVLIRRNRQTQVLEPELAISWKISQAGRKIAFQLRQGVSFSDGTPFTAQDVAATMRALMDPALHSTVGDDFRSGSGEVRTEISGKYSVSVIFPQPVAGL